jgi:hypothetical protein
MWKITYDWLEKKKINKESWDFDEQVWNQLPQEEKVKIKLYDDDDILYFDGIYNDLNESEEKAFAPLDWAMNDSGCTSLKYKCPKDGTWKVL